MLLFLAGLTSILNISILSLIFGFLLVPFFIALMVCLHYNTRKDIRLFSLLGVLFACMYGVLISFNYYLQLTLMQDNSTKLEIFNISNPDSMMWVIEVLGYFFMGLSTLIVIPVFGTTILERLLKLTFIINGFLGIGGLIAYAIGTATNILMVGLMVWNIIMPIAAVLMIFYFKMNAAPINRN
jgi:hypothetical protein